MYLGLLYLKPDADINNIKVGIRLSFK